MISSPAVALLTAAWILFPTVTLMVAADKGPDSMEKAAAAKSRNLMGEGRFMGSGGSEASLLGVRGNGKF